MPPEPLDNLILQNDQRHETLKNLEATSEHQLLKQDEISQGIQEVNQTLENLLLQGDEDKKETDRIIETHTKNTEEIVNAIKETEDKIDVQIDGQSIVFYKGEKGDTGNFEDLTQEQKDSLKGDKGVIDEVKFTETVDKVISTIKGIKPTDLKKVEDLLTDIYNKEDKELDLTDISSTLKNILEEVSKEVETNDDEVLQPDLLKIQNLLDTINKSIKAIKFKDTESFDYEKFGDAIRNNIKLNFGGGGGGSVEVKNKAQQQINPATEDTLTLIKTKTDNLDVALSTRTKPSDQQHAIVDSSALPTGAATSAKQGQYWDVETLAWTDTAGADGSPRSMSYTIAIALGQVTGHASFRGFGQRQSLSIAVTGDDVWEGTATTCPIPASAGEQMTLVSTSASDGVAGTGVRVIDVHYLDATGNEQSELVTMNGVTPVNTVATNIRFVQSIHTNSVGSAGTTVGTITIYKTGASTTIYNILTPGGNMSLNSARMVPFGKTFYMTNLSVAGASNKSVSVKLRATATFEDVLTSGFFLFKDVTFIQNSSREKVFKVPLKFPALCIIKATCYSSQAGGDMSFNYDGWIE